MQISRNALRSARQETKPRYRRKMEMTAREKELIQKTIKGLKENAALMDTDEDRDNLLNRANALEWVLSISEEEL